jgi:hypothetical protein
VRCSVTEAPLSAVDSERTDGKYSFRSAVASSTRPERIAVLIPVVSSKISAVEGPLLAPLTFAKLDEPHHLLCELSGGIAEALVGLHDLVAVRIKVSDRAVSDERLGCRGVAVVAKVVQDEGALSSWG